MKKFNFSKGLVIGLLTLALCLTCFAAAKVSAEDAVTPPAEVALTYDADLNAVGAGANKVVVYVLKAESGNTIKAGSACFTIAANKTATMEELGIKGTNKDVYLYGCDKEFEENGTAIKANLVIKAQEAKKIVGTIDYTKADNATDTGVVNVTATDAKKKNIDLTGKTILWCADANGTYANVDDSTDGFTGGKLAKLLSDGGGVIYIKMKGVTGGNGEATFTSAAVKVKVVKIAKAPKIKFDATKDTLAIKNGFDIAVASGTLKKPTAPDGSAGHTWFTILPLLKTAKTNTAADSIVAIAEYKALDKKDKNATAEKSAETNNTVAYTKYAFKSLAIDDIYTKLSVTATDDFVLAVRKSATNKKPASEITYITIKAKAEAPYALTESKVKGQYLVSSGSDFKKGLSVAGVINYPGTSGTGILATSGFDASFKVTKASDKNADSAPASYEYLIVKGENLNPTDADDAIDFANAAWKKFDPAKAKFTSSMKSKYSTVKGKAVQATLKAYAEDDPIVATPVTAETAFTEGTVILIRRAGVKGKTADDAVRASDYTVLYVVKGDKKYSLYSIKDIGGEAWKFTVQFAKYDGEATTPGYYLDETMTTSVWVAKGETSKQVEIAKPNGFDYVKAAANPANATAVVALPSGADAIATATVDASGSKCYAAITGVADSNTAEQKVTYCLREYANVTITITYDTTDGKAIAADTIKIQGGKLNNLGTVKYYVGEAVAVGDANAISIKDKLDAAKVTDGYTVGITAGDFTLDTGVSIDPAAANRKLGYTAAVVPSAAEVKIEVAVKAENVTISFDSNGGGGSKADVSVKKGGTLTSAQLEKGGVTAPEGKTFGGWSLTKGGSAIDTSTTFGTAGDVTLYAIWNTPTP